MNISTRTILGFSLLALAAGCGTAASTEDLQTSTDGAEAMSASSQSTSLAGNVFENAQAPDPMTAAGQVAAGTASAAGLWPAGCVTRTKDASNPALVHITFNECTGPFGLVHLNGGEDVILSKNADGSLHAAITGVNLTANDKPITYTASADITFPTATTRDVTWQGAWTRTNEEGDAIVHTSSLTIQIDTSTHCGSTSGKAKTTVDDREVDTTISDYQLCRDSTGEVGCPSGSVEHVHEPSGNTVTVDFNGSATADVTGPRGHTFDVPLVCMPLSGT